MDTERHIAVAVERTSEYGRRFLQGVAAFFDGSPDCRLELLDPSRVPAHAEVAYDGWISRITDRHTLRRLHDAGRPVVDAICLAPLDGFSTIRTDAAAIGALAAEHFLAHGFRNFAFCGYGPVAFSERRRDAFAQCLRTRGFRPHVYGPPAAPRAPRPFRNSQVHLTEGTVGAAWDAAALADWIRSLPKPVAIFCCDDFRAADLARICRLNRIAVPDDVALLGVDNDPVYCLFGSSRLSSIDPDAEALGAAAAETLMAGLRADAPRALSRIVPPRGIVVRASTDTYPSAPGWLADALAFIAARVGDGISASDVFAHVGYSRTLVERVFREQLGRTVQTEIANRRVDAAKHLLTTTFLPMAEVAARTGYRSVEYFTRTFSMATGLPPAAYRHSHAPDLRLGRASQS